MPDRIPEPPNNGEAEMAEPDPDPESDIIFEESGRYPGIYPPGPMPGPVRPVAPAMLIEFKFPLYEYVRVKNLGISGTITAAAVAMHEHSVIYLVDVGSGPDRWYPEKMLEDTPFKPAICPKPLAKGQDDNPPGEAA